MRSTQRLAVIALTLLILVGYGVSVADADTVLCFGRDGHAAREGSADHGSSDSRGTSLAMPGEHGACIDVVMLAHDRGETHAASPPAVTALTPVVVSRARALEGPRHARDPLVPHAGFGSTLLRI